jgi:hypothetical protein
MKPDALQATPFRSRAPHHRRLRNKLDPNPILRRLHLNQKPAHLQALRKG